MKQEEQLRLLSIFHYVVAGLSALLACIPIIHLVLGLFLVFAPETFHNKGDNPPPAFPGWFFVTFAAMFILIGWTFAAFIFATGRFLVKRKHYSMFCLVMGGIGSSIHLPDFAEAGFPLRPLKVSSAMPETSGRK